MCTAPGEGLCREERAFPFLRPAGWKAGARLVAEQLCWMMRWHRRRAAAGGAWASEATEPAGRADSRLQTPGCRQRNQVSELLLFGVFWNKQPDLLISGTDTGEDA